MHAPAWARELIQTFVRMRSIDPIDPRDVNRADVAAVIATDRRGVQRFSDEALTAFGVFRAWRPLDRQRRSDRTGPQLNVDVPDTLNHRTRVCRLGYSLTISRHENFIVSGRVSLTATCGARLPPSARSLPEILKARTRSVITFVFRNDGRWRLSAWRRTSRTRVDRPSDPAHTSWSHRRTSKGSAPATPFPMSWLARTAITARAGRCDS